ncbi:MAG: NAD(P)H-hydrate dehydratase [Amylibacter sp.]
MTELLTAAQMRAIEQAAIASGEVTGLELMERAGRGVVEAIFEEWPEFGQAPHRAVVLCGPGNNGGDGFVVARLLHEWGWEVEVFLYGDEAKLPIDAKVNCERWREMGEVISLKNERPKMKFKSLDLIVDAFFGTGLTRHICEVSKLLVGNIFDWLGTGAKFVAIDFPSGICSDSGRPIRNNMAGLNVISANITVTFHARKAGHYLAKSAEDCGAIKLVDIGLRASGSALSLISQPIRGMLALGTRPLSKADLHPTKEANKFSHGHAYILSGPTSKTGAARLAARGALRIGVGVVTVGCPPDALAEHAAQLNVIMLTPFVDAQALTAVFDDQRINAICVGPALGLDQDRAEVLAAVLTAKRATVVDADGLTLLAQHPELMGLLHDKCVLTPHGGEFARVFPDIAEKLAAPATKGPAYSKVDATREAAKRAGCVVLFKGADTVIAAPDGRCAINAAHYERAAPWLATAGSGDVLAGFITGLLARGFAPMQAAETGAWLHVECALKFGPGLIAEDIAEQLPEVFRDLGL